MKYLKYFESYRRQGPGQLPLQEIDIEDFKDLLHTHCKQFLKVSKDIDFKRYDVYDGPSEFLFRKFNNNHGNFVLTNPKESEHRRIAPWSDAGNWHNLLVSNLDSWKDYPRRNKSMIASGWDRAFGHGGTDLYLVIPFDSTKIGVCSGFEFWKAFNVYHDKKDFISDWVRKIINNLNLTDINDDSWEDLLPHLDKKYNRPFFDGYDMNKTLLDNLNIFLDPKKNYFTLGNFREVSKLLKERCRECWFEDEAILINWKYLLNLDKDELKYLFS